MTTADEKGLLVNILTERTDGAVSATHVCVRCGESWSGFPAKWVSKGFFDVEDTGSDETPTGVHFIWRRIAGVVFHLPSDARPHEEGNTCGPVVLATLRDAVITLTADEVEGIVRGAVVRAFGLERGEVLVTRLIAAKLAQTWTWKSPTGRPLLDPELRNYNTHDAAVTAAATPVWRAKSLAVTYEHRDTRAHAFPTHAAQRALCGLVRGAWKIADDDVQHCGSCVHILAERANAGPISGDGGVGGG